MHLPNELKLEIDKKLSNTSLNALKKHSADLSSRYRDCAGGDGPLLTSDFQRLAYLSVRMPATYATIMETLKETVLRLPSLLVESVLDIGAGPGTGLWAVGEFFSESLKRVTLVEQDPSFIQLGKQLASVKPWNGVDIQWERSDVSQIKQLAPHDLVLASFSLGEIKEFNWQRLLSSMWGAAKKVLIIIEPGTPKGFERIKMMRKILLEQGAHLVAPCPHFQTCPMKGEDWCHFAARIERSAAHRQIKNGTMNYEDEKFCYLVFSRESASPIQARILTRPQKNNGYVNLKLCSEKGIHQVTISRKSKEEYRKARKSEWGDSF